jgi:transposase
LLAGTLCIAEPAAFSKDLLVRAICHRLQLELTRFGGHPCLMPHYRTAYPPEFRRQMVYLVRSGRTPEELAREFEPTAQAMATWVKQADRGVGRRIDGPTSVEREELPRLRRKKHRLRQERDTLAKAAAWFAKESKVNPNGFTSS